MGQAVPPPLALVVSRQVLIEGMFRGLAHDWREECLHNLQTCTVQGFQDGMEHNKKAKADGKKKLRVAAKKDNGKDKGSGKWKKKIKRTAMIAWTSLKKLDERAT